MNTSVPHFFNPTDIRWIEWKEVSGLLEVIGTKTLIICGQRFSREKGELMKRELAQSHSVEIYQGVGPNPTVGSVEEVLKKVKDNTPDCVVALGGGSVIDTAKVAALLALNPGSVEEYLLGERVPHCLGLPVIAVPTTSGTGSEVTPFASIINEDHMVKSSMAHKYLYPKHAVLDPQLTQSLSPQQTAISGMDALSQAIEGYWAKASTKVTDALALEGISLILGNLERVVNEPDDMTARREMMNGSLLAGLTISNAKTTAVHSASYPLTARYGIPHGMACGFLLPGFIRFNEPSLDDHKRNALLHHVKVSSMGKLADIVTNLRSRIGMTETLGDMGVRREHIEDILVNGFRPDRVLNNPRKVTPGALRGLLEELL